MRMTENESDVETLIDEERKENGRILRAKALSVPKSSEYPEGVKYRFHYGTFDGETLLRYDNSHGVHERHVGENVEEIAFTNVVELYRQFVDEIGGI